MSADLIDLHTHTTASDGSANPEELIARAATKNARAIAVTDHDTVSAISRARAAAHRLGIEFVAGVEISAEYSPGTLHILGYCIDDRSAPLIAKLSELQHARETRNPQIAARLQALGMDISYDEVATLAGNEVVGRPHFARLMVERGYAGSIQEAFDRFLKKGAAAYVAKSRLHPREAVSLIREAGGVAVLAHPYQLSLSSYDEADELIADLAEFGLDGVEAIYSRHNAQQRASYSEIARRHRLLITGGSDYHGSYKPDIDLVSGLGDLEVPYALLQDLKDRAAATAGSVSPASS